MLGSRVVWFSLGALAGAVTAQLLIRPRSRALAKRLVGGGMSVSDFLLGQVELLREDIADLVAEVREERRGQHTHGEENIHLV